MCRQKAICIFYVEKFFVRFLSMFFMFSMNCLGWSSQYIYQYKPIGQNVLGSQNTKKEAVIESSCFSEENSF